MENDFMKRVSDAQLELKAPKNQYNSFGKYKYRSCEDILEAAKPVCAKHGLVLTLSDTIEHTGERYYIKATATLYNTTDTQALSSTAYARESADKKGMDDSQITGTASSYARKYALNGLFNIDDTKDADDEASPLNASRTAKTTAKSGYYCCDCGKEITAYGSMSAAQVYDELKKRNKDGQARCKACVKKIEEANN